MSDSRINAVSTAYAYCLETLPNGKVRIHVELTPNGIKIECDGVNECQALLNAGDLILKL